MIVLRELAPAKINLYLHVIGKRKDGYHLLDSLIGFADLHDKLEVVPADTITVAVEGPFAPSLSADDNSVIKAARALQALSKVTAGAAITLHKNLPVGAGIGGGSADAAAVLRLLMRFWKIKPSPKEIHTLALSLGADVPACMRSSSLYMSGIGEVIEPGPVLSDLWIVLVHPAKPLLSAQVFKDRAGAFSQATSHPHAFLEPQAAINFLQKTRNDLQSTAAKLVPEIGDVLDALSAEKECMLARMSGSGSACFGVFSNQQQADKMQLQLSARHPGWWIKTAHIR